MHFTGLQLRAARGLLRITADQLSKMAGVSSVTIRRAELEDGPVSMSVANLFAVERALKKAGVLFIEPEEGVGGPGVRLKWGFDPARPDATTSAAKGETQGEGGQSAAWDEEAGGDWEGEAPAPALERVKDAAPVELDQEDREALVEHYRARPEAWAALREVSRQALLRAMGLERLG